MSEYLTILAWDRDNSRNYLYRDLFEIGHCASPLDVNAVAQSISRVHAYLQSEKVAAKPDHLFTVRVQVEQLVKGTQLMMPSATPNLMIGTQRDWFLLQNLPLLTTAIVVLRCLMTSPHAARGGDYTHTSSNMLWSELKIFAMGRMAALQQQSMHLQTHPFPDELLRFLPASPSRQSPDPPAAAAPRAKKKNKSDARPKAKMNGHAPAPAPEPAAEGEVRDQAQQ